MSELDEIRERLKAAYLDSDIYREDYACADVATLLDALATEQAAHEETRRDRDRLAKLLPGRFTNPWYAERYPEHAHSNPSPSLESCGYCNGTQEDPGCGQLIPVRTFPLQGFDNYLVDGRTPKGVEHPAVLRRELATAEAALEAAQANEQLWRAEWEQITETARVLQERAVAAEAALPLTPLSPRRPIQRMARGEGLADTSAGRRHAPAVRVFGWQLLVGLLVALGIAYCGLWWLTEKSQSQFGRGYREWRAHGDPKPGRT